jgi:Fe2+ or Zn2+ uptake regulation protein
MSLFGIVLTPEELCEFIGIDFTVKSVQEFCDKYGFDTDKTIYRDLESFVYDDLVNQLNENKRVLALLCDAEFEFHILQNEMKIIFGFTIKHKSSFQELSDKISRLEEITNKDCMFYNECSHCGVIQK